MGIDGRRPIEETTSAQYAFLIRKYIKPSIGLLRIADLTKPMILRWRVNQVSEIGKDATKRALGVVRQVLAYQAVIGSIPHNPASEVKLAAAAKKKRRSTVGIDDDPDDVPVSDYMAPEDVRAMLHTVDIISATGKLATDAQSSKPMSPGNQAKRRKAWIKYRALIYLLVAGGLRIGEACALQWKHILWGDSAIDIRQAYKRTGKGKAKIGPPKNAASLRTITVGPEVMSLLHALHASENTRTEPQFVFGTDEPPSPSNIRNRCWVPLMTEAKLLMANGRLLWALHDCRHYHASALINANRPLQQVSERLGHANTVVTQTVYAHLFKKLKGLGNTLGIEMESALLGKG
ncbi:MAG TPA: tyrosine-type recombinase/integrase [Novosphingobium sp.]